jgi:hypothetical protein
LAVVKIQLGLAWEQRLKNFRVDGEVQHRQVTPVGGEKWFQHGGSSAPSLDDNNGGEAA